MHVCVKCHCVNMVVQNFSYFHLQPQKPAVCVCRMLPEYQTSANSELVLSDDKSL